MAASIQRRFLPGLVLLLWAAGVAVGFTYIWRYEATPGASANQPADHWPTTFSIALDSSRPTLIMAVHPECPCSRASVGELEQILSHRPGALRALVLFVPELHTKADPSQCDLWKQASSIPGVTCVRDSDNAAVTLFHACTSGHTFLYDQTGALRFSGGITESRGHAGDNDGRTAIETYLAGGNLTITSTPVFGCSLR
jgi:hypothetical protein